MSTSSVPPLPPTAAVPGVWRRLSSMVYEALLLLAVFFLADFAFLLVERLSELSFPKFVLQAYLLAVAAAYFIGYWTHGGQTLAMKAWRIRVEPAAGGPMPVAQAGLRFVLAVAGIGFFGAGLVYALFDRERQFLHDRLAGTRVVRTG